MILTRENIDKVDIDFLINQKIQSSKLNEILFIVPTNRKIRYFKKELISLLPGKTSGKLNLETIGTISVKLLEYCFTFKPLSEAASSVLLRQSTSEVKLKYLSQYKDEIPVGTLERIRNVITEYKRQGILPDKLRADAELLTGSEKLKAIDISEIYKIYKLKCLQLSALETGDIYEKLNELGRQEFTGSFKNLYPDVDLVVLIGFDEFSNPEIEIINSISEIKGLKIFINFDYFINNPRIFSHLNKCYDKFIANKFNIVEELSYPVQENFSNIIRNNLFQKRKETKVENYKSKITLIPAADRVKEIELAAKEIKELILVKKIEPNKICIAFNLIDKYSPIVRDIFSTFNIPFNLTDRISLANSYPVTSIINLLEILENDFYYKNIFRALSSGFLNYGEINLAGLIKTAAELKIVAGLDSWINSIKDDLNSLEENPEIDFTDVEKKRDLYLKTASDINLLSEILDPFNKKLSIKEFLDNLIKLIYKLEVPKNLIHDLNEREEENIRAVTVFLNTITEIFELLKLEFGENKKFPLSFFLEQIRTVASSGRFNVKEKSAYGVLVTTINEIRGLKFEYLFLSGLCDGDFPTRFDPEIFLTGSYAKSELIHQTEERYHFYQTICSWQKGLYLTFPLQEKNKELVQSNFLKDFTALFELTEKSAGDYEHSVYSIEEIFKLIGLYGLEKVKEIFGNRVKNIDWEIIGRSLNVADERMKNLFGNSVYNGILVPSDISGMLDTITISDEVMDRLQQLGDREYSVTQLEQYAKCPYQYFLKRILNIDVLKEPTEEIEAFELGTLLHSILFNFYKETSSKKIILKNCSEEVFNNAVDFIFNLAEKEIEKASFTSPFSFYEKEKILGINRNKKNSILYKFIENEREDDTKFLPEYFELAFGRYKNEKVSDELSLEQLSIGEVKIRGKIDRVEINEQRKYFNISDYKLSGNKPTEKDLMNGLSLQLPLYLYAASKMLKEHFNIEYEPANAFIYSLKYKDGEFGKSSISIRRGKGFDELDEQKQREIIDYNIQLIKVCEESIQKYVNGIKAGRFNLSLLEDREQKVCRYCDFRSICRIQEAG
jgi:ATP-dependent helicase/nuclease subunit B